MVFIVKLLRAVSIKKRHEEYLEFKKLTLEEQEKKLNLYRRFKLWWQRTCPLLCGGIRQPNTPFSKLHKLQINIKTEGTYENFVAKSFLGFASGVLLTYMFFVFFALQLKFSLVSSTWMASVLGLILTLGLAFTSRVRCVVLMLLPQFFSKRGRQAIIAYAYILTLSGPTKNSLYNMGVLSETMACNQEKLKTAVKSIIALIKKPFTSLRDTVKKVSEKVKVIVDKVKAMLNAIKKTLQSLIGVVKSAYDWLNSIVGMCSKKAGTPYERCTKAFDDAIVDCKDKLGSTFDWMCSPAYVASTLCYAVKPFDYICDLIDFVSDEIVVQVKKKLQEFVAKVRTIFYVSIEFSHGFGFSTQQSKSIKEVSKGIIEEVKQKTKKLSVFFSWMSVGLSFFFIFMVVKVLNYRRKFMTNDAFDNHFITENVIKVDINRTQRGLETILPLNIYERRKYVNMTSMRLVKNEKAVIAKSAVFLAITSVKLILQMIVDYCLYWVLNIIRVHGNYEARIDAPGSINVQVNGAGMLSELYASVLNAFQPSGINPDMDIAPCLPDPRPPNFSTYKRIGCLLAIAWVLSLSEPYGLRLRFAVMSYYNPDRAKVRAVWLYNHILRSRGSFLKYARRQLRRQFGKGGGIENVSFIDRLRAKFPWLRRIWKGKKFTACLLCGSIGNKNSPLVKCPRPDCVGEYCVDCYATLQNICTICLLPIEYNDISDISEERDSSEENNPRSSNLNKVEESTDTSEELNLSEALLPDEGDSQLSYDYQYRERDMGERMIIAPQHKDLEAQERKEMASINDFGEGLPPERKSTTLAERKKSGIWELISGQEAPKLSEESQNRKSSKKMWSQSMEKTLHTDEVQLLLLTNESSTEGSESFHSGKRNARKISSKSSKLEEMSPIYAGVGKSFMEMERKHFEEIAFPIKTSESMKGSRRVLGYLSTEPDLLGSPSSFGSQKNSLEPSNKSRSLDSQWDRCSRSFKQRNMYFTEYCGIEVNNESGKDGGGFQKRDAAVLSNIRKRSMPCKSFAKILSSRKEEKTKFSCSEVEYNSSDSYKQPQEEKKFAKSNLKHKSFKLSHKKKRLLKPKSILKKPGSFEKNKNLLLRKKVYRKDETSSLPETLNFSDRSSNSLRSETFSTPSRFLNERKCTLKQCVIKRKLFNESHHFKKKPFIFDPTHCSNIYPISNTAVCKSCTCINSNTTYHNPFIHIQKKVSNRSDHVEKPCGNLFNDSNLGLKQAAGKYKQANLPKNVGLRRIENPLSIKNQDNIQERKANLFGIDRPAKVGETPLVVHCIQPSLAEIKRQGLHWQKENILRKTESARNPEMIKKWIETGKYHTYGKDCQMKKKDSIFEKLWLVPVGVQKLFNIFRKGLRRIEESSDFQMEFVETTKIERFHQLNIIREKRKKEYKKQVNIKKTFWGDLMFWRKESNSSNLNSIKSTSSSEGISVHVLQKVPPKEVIPALNLKKTKFKKTIYCPTPAQLVYEKFQVEENVSSC